MIPTKRDEHERHLARALDRSIGYTKGAFDLNRIASVPTLFQGRSTSWDVELVNSLLKDHDIRKDYAEGILDFGAGLGLIAKLKGQSNATRIRLTDLGRSYCAAAYCNNVELQNFVLTYAVLEADCDLYGVLLNALQEERYDHDTPSLLGRELQDLRKRRISWLEEYLPDYRLRRRITERISWLRKKPPEPKSASVAVKSNYARHHSIPRRGWATSLGHVLASGKLSVFGQELCRRIRGDDGLYFWIGPAPAVWENLKLPDEARREPAGPVWNILRPRQAVSESEKIVDRLAEFMAQVYPAVRMEQSNQASLGTVLPFLYWQEWQLGVRTIEADVLRRLFSKYGHRFAPMSKRHELLGHYQVRQ